MLIDNPSLPMAYNSHAEGVMNTPVPHMPAVEEECEFRWFDEPGRPVKANGVSINGENASRTRENVVGREIE
jgi:hypothetical protein